MEPSVAMGLERSALLAPPVQAIQPPDGDQLRGVLLDVDGTLIDSNDAHASAWVEALRDRGIVVEFDRVRPLIGMAGDKLLPAVSGLAAESPTGVAVGRRRQEIFRTRYLPHLRAFPDTRALLERLVAHGVRLYVASSAQSDELKPLLEPPGAPPACPFRASRHDWVWSPAALPAETLTAA